MINAVRSLRIAVVILCLLTLGACAGISEGITRAFLAERDKPKHRLCHVRGQGFQGLRAAMDQQRIKRSLTDNTPADRTTTKLLMVHGIGTHIPGYSGRLTHLLVPALGLDAVDKAKKSIDIVAEEFPDTRLGELNIQRFMNRKTGQELLFYELTWSQITEDEKALLRFDESEENAVNRADVNHAIKVFLNDRVLDPMLYVGSSGDKIRASVSQAMCWMSMGDWDDLPDSGRQFCDLGQPGHAEQIMSDDYFFITHSLGSRIVVDTFQQSVRRATLRSRQSSESRQARQVAANMTRLLEALKTKQFNIYMLANQLALLQVGHPPVEERGMKAAFCDAGGKRRSERFIQALNITAFSDPNDLLSYPIPDDYADTQMNPRLCARTTNINIGVAPVFAVPGFGKAANPVDAHLDYEQDPLVIRFLVEGLPDTNVDPMIKKYCSWLHVVD